MKVPGAERAFVDIAKILDYSLNSAHREGKHKARVFAAALDLTEDDADWLRQILLDVVRRHDCQLGRKTPFGQRYIVDFPLARADKQARVRSVWNIRRLKISLALSPVMCYKISELNARRTG